MLTVLCIIIILALLPAALEVMCYIAFGLVALIASPFIADEPLNLPTRRTTGIAPPPRPAPSQYSL